MKTKGFIQAVKLPYRYMIKMVQKFGILVFFRKLTKALPLPTLKRHGYIVASSGSGKSELIKLLVYHELNRHHPSASVIVLDPHGDMVKEIAGFKEFSDWYKLDRLVYIDPNLKDGYLPSINPFEGHHQDEKQIALMTQEIKGILQTLLQGAGTTHQMDALLSPCIATLLRRPNSSLVDLQHFMDDQHNAELVLQGTQSPNPQHSQFFREAFHLPAYASTKQGIYTRLQGLLNDPVFHGMITQPSTLNLSSLINQKKMILFKLPLGESGSESMQGFGRFLVGMLRIIALQRSQIPENKRTPIYLILDEFQNFISEDIETALTQLRKYGLHLILAHQYIGQRISPSLQKALFGSGVKIAGKNDHKSLSRIGTEMNVPVNQLQQLKTGEFMVQTGYGPAQKIRTPRLLLKNNHCMKSRDWQLLKSSNLNRYYAKVYERSQEDEIANLIKLGQSSDALDRQLELLEPKYPLPGN